MALIIVSTRLREPSCRFIVGVERPARVIAPSPYDPAGKAMRM